jgi:hypothetical protein
MQVEISLISSLQIEYMFYIIAYCTREVKKALVFLHKSQERDRTTPGDREQRLNEEAET